MKTVIFDVDGTLVQSFEFDERCYIEAVFETLGVEIDSQWSSYKHVTDSGLLMECLSKLGRATELSELEPLVKSCFIKKIANYLAVMPVDAIAGARDFFHKLKSSPNISIAIATGGWSETATMKLESAGIDVAGVPLVSSNDHYSRTEIMKIAYSKASQGDVAKVSYFGDAVWDKRACEKLNWDFVLVGAAVQHEQRIDDYCDQNLVMSLLGLA